MGSDEVFNKVRAVLVDALAVDEDEVTAEASLVGDLGAESIDFLDIQFKLEQAFNFKIPQGELFPENVAQDPKYVREGKVTPEGIAALRARLPHINFTKFEANPMVSKVADLFTVETVVKYVERKIAGK